VLPTAATAGQYTDKPADEAPKNDTTSLNFSAGGSANSGNTKAYQLNAGGDFRLVRNPHGVAAAFLFGYGRAAIPGESTSLRESIKNLSAKARYDFFITQMDSVFLATTFLWDPFAGINRRNQGQIGYLRYIFVEEKHRLWGELGYDLTSDNYRQLPDKPPPPKKTDVLHSARAFIGYDNKLNDAVSYLGGVEVLVNLTESKHTRVAWDNALRSSLAGAFKLELKFRLAYDQAAPADRNAERLDTSTLISLLYTLI
jgi:putative salt-induced outer membrane protein YdiY